MNGLLDALRVALDAEARAVDETIAAATLDDAPAPERRRAALSAVEAYEQATRLVERLLDAAVTRPAPGLLATLAAPREAAFWRVLDAGEVSDPAARERAVAVALHHHQAMTSREARVQREVIAPWVRARAALNADSRRDETPAAA